MGNSPLVKQQWHPQHLPQRAVSEANNVSKLPNTEWVLCSPSPCPLPTCPWTPVSVLWSLVGWLLCSQVCREGDSLSSRHQWDSSRLSRLLIFQRLFSGPDKLTATPHTQRSQCGACFLPAASGINMVAVLLLSLNSSFSYSQRSPHYYLRPGFRDPIWGGEYARWVAFFRYWSLFPQILKLKKKINYSLPMENFPKCTAYTSLPCGRARAFLDAWAGAPWGMLLLDLGDGRWAEVLGSPVRAGNRTLCSGGHV